MFSGVTSSARSPSRTKMMIRRAVDPASCCGAARLLPDPNTKSDKALKQNRSILVFIFMVVLVSQLCAGAVAMHAHGRARRRVHKSTAPAQMQTPDFGRSRAFYIGPWR